MDLKTFLENFEAIAEAPSGITKLRSLILDLAVQGKLVPQNSEDKPASVLVEKIRFKKEQLIKEKKIRQSDSLPPVELKEMSYELPNGWGWIRFGDATICRDGERIPLSREQRTLRQGEYDYYGASGIIDKIDDYLFDEPLLLIGEDGANLVNRSTPIAFIANGKYWVNNHAHVLDSLSVDCLRYFEVFINAIDLKPYITGTAQPKMNQAKMNSIPVPLPPLAEQKRIVEKVDELMGLCDRYEAAKQTRDNLRQKLRGSAIAFLMNAETDEKLDAAWAFVRENWQNLSQQSEDVDGLRQSILQLAVQGKLLPQEPSDDSASVLLEKINFSRRLKWEKKQLEEFSKKGKRPSNETWKAKYPEPDSLDLNNLPNIPESWEWCSLSSIAEHIVDGTHHTPTYVDKGIPFISAKDIINGQINFESCRMIPQTEYMTLSQRCNPQINNLLVTKSGTIGRVAIVKTSEKFTLFESVALVPLLDIVEPDYIAHVAYLSCSGEFGKTNQKGMAVRHLHLKELRQLPIPLPPLAEQKRIVAKVDELMKLCDQLEASLNNSQQWAESLAASAISHLTI